MSRFLLLAFIVVFACGKSSPIDKDFALAYAELRIAEREYGETEDGKAIRFQILEKYELSAEIFEEKIEAMKKEPEKWQEFQKTLVAILDSIASSNKLEEEN